MTDTATWTHELSMHDLYVITSNTTDERNRLEALAEIDRRDEAEAVRLAELERENATLRNSLEACRNAAESIRDDLGQAWIEMADARARIAHLEQAS